MTNDLARILRENEETIRNAWAEQAARAGCDRAMGDAPDQKAAVAALLEMAESDDAAAAASRWAARVSLAPDKCPDAIAALGCLERVVRFFILKHLQQKSAILNALNRLGENVDLLRRCAIQPERGGMVQRALQLLAEYCGDFICLADLQGKPFYLNSVARRLAGLIQGNASAGLPDSLKYFHEDDYWAVLRDTAVPTVKRSGRWQGRGRLRADGGNMIEVETSMFVINEAAGEEELAGKPLCLAVVHRDVGQLVRVENALEESRARKTAILESSLDPIITIDHRGMITEFNRAAEQVFGRSRNEVLGTQPSEILFPAAKIAGYQNRIDRYLDAGEGSLLSKRNEVIAVRASGLPFEAELTMTINQEHGNPVLTFFVRDISKRKRAEEEQLRYAQELEQSNRELEQFAYVASHDLQEPLRKIRTFGDRLVSSYGGSLDETGRECLGRMQNAAERMQELIKGLLTLSRITTRAAEFEPVDLSLVAREVVSDLEVKIENTGARIEVGKLPTIQADPLQMRQLLQNLIGNALKFHRPDDPPVVEVEALITRKKQHTVGSAAADEQCRISVRDNGIGFDEKYLDRIFDVFQRLHPRDVHEGTGIGLAICRKIAERHGGSITAESAPDQGAKFTVVLPVRQVASNSWNYRVGKK